MGSESDRKIALALLKEVSEKVEQTLGSQIGLPPDPNADIEESAEIAVFCKDMVKQCEIAEKKTDDDQEILMMSCILKAQLYGNWVQPMGVRGTHKKAIQCYEKALECVPDGDVEAEAEIRYKYAQMARVSVVGGGKEKVIQNFERVLGLVGIDSKLGIECAKELEKEKSKKKGCFIATAVCGSPFANEVIWLSRFRDEVLSNNAFGRHLIRAYYATSPSIAAVVARNKVLRSILRSTLIRPISRFVRHRLTSKGGGQDT